MIINLPIEMNFGHLKTTLQVSQAGHIFGSNALLSKSFIN